MRFSVVHEGRELPAALAVAWAPPPGATDMLETRATAWLRGEERERFARFAVEHARGDFLAGRVAAKSALQSLAPQSRPDEWEIVRGVWHQPCVRGPVGGLGVTLSHAGGIGVAVAFDDRWQCGIDLETSAREAESAIESQVSTAETSWAREAATARERSVRWLLLWTAREAQGKCLRSGLLLSGALAPAMQWQPAPHGWRARLGDHDLLAVRALVTPRCVLSLVTPVSTTQALSLEAAATWLRSQLE